MARIYVLPRLLVNSNLLETSTTLCREKKFQALQTSNMSFFEPNLYKKKNKTELNASGL